MSMSFRIRFYFISVCKSDSSVSDLLVITIYTPLHTFDGVQSTSNSQVPSIDRTELPGPSTENCHVHPGKNFQVLPRRTARLFQAELPGRSTPETLQVQPRQTCQVHPSRTARFSNGKLPGPARQKAKLLGPPIPNCQVHPRRTARS